MSSGWCAPSPYRHHFGNPGLVEAQLMGGTLFGLSAALFGEISVSGGQVEQGNRETATACGRPAPGSCRRCTWLRTQYGALQQGRSRAAHALCLSEAWRSLQRQWRRCLPMPARRRMLGCASVADRLMAQASPAMAAAAPLRCHGSGSARNNGGFCTGARPYRQLSWPSPPSLPPWPPAS